MSELSVAMNAYKPQLIAAYKRIVISMFNVMVKKFGVEMKGIYNSTYCSSWKGHVRPACEFTKTDFRGNGTYAIDEHLLQKNAEQYADVVVESWLGKIQSKMGELDSAEAQYVDGTRFTICGTKFGKRVKIDQDMILNQSSKGLLFNQFPARIYVEGKFISESGFKRLTA